MTSSAPETEPATAAAAAVVPAMPKLLHLQILRAVAASLVVTDHAILALPYNNFSVEPFVQAAYALGHIGVCAFFVLSGFIMVRQSATMFGQPGSPLVFAWHRILRIVPLYWLATIAWYGSMLLWHNVFQHPALQLLLSFSFLPDIFHPDVNMEPILNQGWTLNYEMGFYLLFTICLLLPRKKGIPVLLATLAALAYAGTKFHFANGSLPQSLWHFYTNWLILLFGAGMVIGVVESKIGSFKRISCPVSPAFLLALPVLLALKVPWPLLSLKRSWVWYACFGGLIVLICTLTSLDRPGRFNRFLVLLGDASYSTYLVHIWAFNWVLPFVVAHPTRLRSQAFTVGVSIVAGVIAANLLGLAVHFAIERPITKALRRIKFGVRQRPVTA